MDPMQHPFIRRLALRSLMGGPDECWLWQGATCDGYGIITIRLRPSRAHRVAWEILVGPCPEGLEPDHTCRRRNCWNPRHLDWVTHRENVLRGVGITAVNAAKTHCVHGHEFTPENTMLRPWKGVGIRRQCRQCQARLERARVLRRRAEREQTKGG